MARGAWWSIYQDAAARCARSSASRAANQNLKAALARLEQARAQTRIARAAYFPTITAGASAARDAPVGQLADLQSRTSRAIYNDFTLEADLSYEFDVWGRVRNTVAAARATQQASAADLATLDLSTHAELATDYFTLRSDDAQAAAARSHGGRLRPGAAS